MSKTKEVGDGIRQAVFGANDGVVSTFGILSGLVGATLASPLIALVGIVQMFAAGMSMALGAYISTKSQNEYYSAQREAELKRVHDQPEKERKEVEDILRERGLSGKTLTDATTSLTKDDSHWVSFILEERFGIADTSFPNPVRAGIVMFIAFVVAGFLPVFPYLLFSAKRALIISAIFSLLALFTVGAYKTRFTNKSSWLSGLENMLIGAVTGVIGFAVGSLISSVWQVAL